MHSCTGTRPRRPRGGRVLLAAALAAAALAPGGLPFVAAEEPADPVEATIGDYFQELERAGLIDVNTGSQRALAAELRAAEALLADGNPFEAAVALYAIVESPRFTDFSDTVEYQNAEYALGVALAASGAYESALDTLVRVLERGPSSMYFAPAHRRAVDIALETRDYRGVLARLDALRLSEPLPPGAVGEQAYLRARAAYAAGDLGAAEAELVKIGRKSRLYSSALYLRGVIRARRGELQAATDALCEIAQTPDTDKYTFVVDDRYFTIKDLARLGLGRIAHEEGRYDDAYYHYFQIPDDSDRLPEALFEAAWSMYQKRELPTARDLVDEFLRTFPDSPLVPEALLLAGYIELADCQFTAAQAHFDRVVARIQPVVDELAALRKDPDRRSRLFDRALRRWRRRRDDPDARRPLAPKTRIDQVVALLRLDPQFVRLHEAIAGMRRAAGDAPHAVRAWTTLARRVARQRVGAAAREPTAEQEDADDANALLEDVRRLRDEVDRARAELRRGVRAGTLPADAADAERKRLDLLASEIDVLEADVDRAARAAEAALLSDADAQLGHLVGRDLAAARALRVEAAALLDRLQAAADRLAAGAVDRLYSQMRRVVDKAKLGKIDAVIGQKRRLDIEVADLSAGRYPPELFGRMWEQGLIGDDEEVWPFEGELWRDEYEGWR
ncbi:MAG: hypothetical protein D6689_01790 [Deltaproteobacteria bacterium]|nr:MAG: hypothetical protein D6689_01790 [Deltaproteobacteria bacterium]